MATHCYIPSSVAVHYLKTELTYLSSQSPGVSIHHSTIIARVISLLLVLYYRAGRPGSSEVPRNSEALGREFDPGKRDFSQTKKQK